MHGREALLAGLARDRVATVAARHRAAMMWRDHPARQALRARLDALMGLSAEGAAAAIAALFARGDLVSTLMADLTACLAREPFFDPPCPVIRDELHSGIVLLDHDVALVTLSTASVDAIAARKACGQGAGSVGFSGAVSVMRFHRAGRARLRFWCARGGRCRPVSRLRDCSDGEVLVIDGRRHGYVIECCASDIVMLRATLRVGQAALRREYDAQSRTLLGVASADEAASRSQMLLTLLRIAGGEAAGPGLRAAIDSEPHFVRWHAMREYLAHDPPAALPLLQRMAAGDPHDEVRAAAEATLAAIAARNPGRVMAAPCRA